MSEHLRVASGIWTMLHIAVLFALVCIPKFSTKKALAAFCGLMVSVVGGNVVLFVLLGQETYGKVLLLSVTLPFLVIAFLFAKKRTLAFFFTFFLVNTVCTALLVLSILFNFYLTPESNIVMAAMRLVMYPALEFVVYKWLRRPYFEIQRSVKRGWGIFSMLTAVYLVLLVGMTTWPVFITKRPDDIPALFTLILLVPLICFALIWAMSRQMLLGEVAREKELWQIQATYMQRQITQLGDTAEQIKIARHDLRHRLNAIDVMLQKGESEEARQYIAESIQTLDTPKVNRYCVNAMMDAIFSYYFKLAQEKGIRVEHNLQISDELPVVDSELSVVVANVLENAIHACEPLPPEKRIIRCRCIESPQFMLQITNPYIGTVDVDDRGIPVDKDGQRGVGTRSILAFCEKHDAQLNYKIRDGLFSLRIVVQNFPAKNGGGGG